MYIFSGYKSFLETILKATYFMALVINCLNFKFHNVRFEQFVVRKAKEYSVYNLIGKDSKVDFMLLRLSITQDRI